MAQQKCQIRRQIKQFGEAADKDVSELEFSWFVWRKGILLLSSSLVEKNLTLCSPSHHLKLNI